MTPNRDGKVVSESVANLFQRIHDECLPSIDRATVAFYGVQNDRIVKDRTGVLLRIADSVFILTASHDLLGIVQNNIPLYVGWNERTELPIPLHDAKFHTTEFESSIVGQDVVRDVAAIKLSAETANEITAGGRMPISLFDISTEQVQAPGLYVLFGFPQAWFRVDKSGPKCTALVYACSRYSGEHWSKASVGYDPKVHLLLDLKRDAIVPTDGQPATLPGYDGIRGVSGCGIWRVANMDSSINSWKPEQCKLVAIQHRYYEEPGYVHTTWIQYAIGRILDDYPELKAATDIAYRR